MPAIRIQGRASRRLDEVYRYTRERWGDVQAEQYLAGMFAAFDGIATHGVLARPIPAEFGVNGYFIRYKHHVIYWRHLANGDIGIVTVLHERMHQRERLRDEFGPG